MPQNANLGEESEYARAVSDGSYRQSMGVNRTVVTHTEEDSWGPPGRLTINLRQVINGILYVDKIGCRWRMTPKTYGHWNTL